MGTLRRRLDSLVFPAVLIIWVTCGTVLICQYKGMIPWFEQLPEAIMVLITAIPPLLLVVYVIVQIVKILTSK
jgi:hypothetical protein